MQSHGKTLLAFALIHFVLPTDELNKKDLHDPDNHKGVTTPLEPDMLECEVTALGSITMNKASGGAEIPVELFQILKDDAITMLH